MGCNSSKDTRIISRKKFLTAALKRGRLTHLNNANLDPDHPDYLRYFRVIVEVPVMITL